MSIDPLSERIAQLSDVVIQVLETTTNFKPQLIKLDETLRCINTMMVDNDQLNHLLDRACDQSDMFVKDLEAANILVRKCEKVKWNPIKRFRYSRRLNVLISLFELKFKADICRNNKRILIELNHVTTRLNALVNNYSLVEGPSSRRGAERYNLGWRVPPRPLGIVTFEEPLKKLKTKVLASIDTRDDDNDASEVAKVVLVSGAGGCGKTTLVKMLCYDTEILETFGDNIFYVMVSETPAFTTIVDNLFNPNSCQQVSFQSIEDAQNELEIFFHEKLSGPILLVLDDVWSESFIKHFQFNIKVRYRVVVTSRMNFQEMDVFKFDPPSV